MPVEINGKYYSETSKGMIEVHPFRTHQFQNEFNRETVVAMSFDNFMLQYNDITVEQIIRELARRVADKIIEDHFQEIVANIDMQAVSNMAVANAGAEIKKKLDTLPSDIANKMPRTIVKNEAHFHKHTLW